MFQDNLSVPSSGFKNPVPVIPFISLPSTSNIFTHFLPDLPVQKQPIPHEVFGSLKKPQDDDDDDD